MSKPILPRKGGAAMYVPEIRATSHSGKCGILVLGRLTCFWGTPLLGVRARIVINKSKKVEKKTR